MSLTPEQLEQRLNYVTGTDAGIICGVNPYKTRLQLWMEKTRSIKQEEVNNRFVKAGNYLEPVISRWFCDETKLSVNTNKNNLIIHPEHDFIAGNIDGFIENENLVFEAKTSAYGHGFGPQGSFEMPDHYLCQLAHYVACTNADGGILCVLIGGNDLRWYHYERDEALEAMIISKEKEFWELVKSGTKPEPQTVEDIELMYGKISQCSAISADTETLEAAYELAEVRDKIDEYTSKQKALENKIKIYMGINDTLVSNNSKIATWKSTKASVVLDSKKLQKEKPEIYNEYLTKREPTRRFLLNR